MDETAAPLHPYYPLTASMPTYVANESSVLRLLVTFGVMVGVVTGLAYWQTLQSPLRLRPIDRFAVVWFALCWCCSCLCVAHKANFFLQVDFCMLDLKVCETRLDRRRRVGRDESRPVTHAHAERRERQRESIQVPC